MVKIEYFYTDRMYKYLWLKYVTGTNLSVHCARCLLGEYEVRFKGYIRSLHDIELKDAPVYYLCGVAHDRVWKHNLHIAFVAAAGQMIEVDDEFCRLRIANARRLEISTGTFSSLVRRNFILVAIGSSPVCLRKVNMLRISRTHTQTFPNKIIFSINEKTDIRRI